MCTPAKLTYSVTHQIGELRSPVGRSFLWGCICDPKVDIGLPVLGTRSLLNEGTPGAFRICHFHGTEVLPLTQF